MDQKAYDSQSEHNNVEEDPDFGDDQEFSMSEEPALDEDNRRELTRMRDLKNSQQAYMREIKASGKKQAASRKTKGTPEEKMKELIAQAEKLTSFLLSKHNMNAGDPRDTSPSKPHKASPSLQ